MPLGVAPEGQSIDRVFAPAPKGAVCATSPFGRKHSVAFAPKGFQHLKVQYARLLALPRNYWQSQFMRGAHTAPLGAGQHFICPSGPRRGTSAHIFSYPKGQYMPRSGLQRGSKYLPRCALWAYIADIRYVVAPSGQEQYIAHRGPFGATSKAAGGAEG